MDRIANRSNRREQTDKIKRITSEQRNHKEIAPPYHNGTQPSTFNEHTPKWQDILWREWRYCEDEEYARHLFNWVSSAPLDWSSILILALTGTLYGLLVGYLLALIVVNKGGLLDVWLLTETLPLILVWLSGISGGLGGVWLSQRFSWRVWLGLLTPNVFANKIGELGQSSLGVIFGFIAGLFGLGPLIGGALGVLSGIIFHNRGIVAINDTASNSTHQTTISNRGIIVFNGMAGVVSALIGGLARQGGWPGIGLSMAAGVWLGVTWGSIPLILLVSGLSILFGLVIFGLGSWLTVWLGLVIGFGLGTIPNLIGSGLEAIEAYHYRFWYFWWRGQPSTTQVEEALKLTGQPQPEIQVDWAEPLRRLEQQKERLDQPNLLIAALKSPDWVERFVARHALVALGGEAVESLRLQAVASSNPLRPIVIGLLTQIERETTLHLAWRIARLLCPHCLTRFGPRSANLNWGVSFSYYGCRICGQSREFLERPKVVAVLDNVSASRPVRDTNGIEPDIQSEDQLRLNWLQRRTLFDFDQIEIIQATDEDVERFAVQVGNDTDPFRQPRYSQIPCVIASTCRLSENTLRILRRTFGIVEQKELVS